MSKYIVESIVCDWAIYSIDNYENKELVEVCNSKANAELICEIFNADLAKDGKYTIWKDQKLADLEAKLAESERQYQEYRQIVEKDIEKELDERMRDTIKEFNLDISQLKQQLTEKDQVIEGLQEINQSLGQTCNNDAKEIERLREQLAEKDELYRTCCEQCERIKDKLGIITSYNQDLQNKILDKHKTNEKLKKSQNQTAIDELEKVISYLSDRTDVINDELKNFDRDEISVRFAVQKRLITDIFYVIDQQIKSLKGEK